MLGSKRKLVVVQVDNDTGWAVHFWVLPCIGWVRIALALSQISEIRLTWRAYDVWLGVLVRLG